MLDLPLVGVIRLKAAITPRSNRRHLVALRHIKWLNVNPYTQKWNYLHWLDSETEDTVLKASMAYS